MVGPEERHVKFQEVNLKQTLTRQKFYEQILIHVECDHLQPFVRRDASMVDVTSQENACGYLRYCETQSLLH